MNLGQLNISGEIYHIRMDHQLPSHFLSLPHQHGLSDAILNQHDHVNKLPSSSPLSMAAVRNHTEDGPLQETAYSDIRSMSVDPGSLDEPLSSGSAEGAEGVSKEGEFSGGVDDVVVVSGNGADRPLSGGSKPLKKVVVSQQLECTQSEVSLGEAIP
jgi:hypothetical protein